jgi:cytochrome c556
LPAKRIDLAIGAAKAVRSKFSAKSITLAAAILGTAASASAQQAAKPEDLIKWRQSAYQVAAWNSGRIKANVEGQYNKDEVIRAANSIAAIANSGLGALYAPGSEQGSGWHETSVRADLFRDTQRVAELADNFSREANELAKLAAVGNVTAVKAQYVKLNRSCKTCHDDFKSKD